MSGRNYMVLLWEEKGKIKSLKTKKEKKRNIW